MKPTTKSEIEDVLKQILGVMNDNEINEQRRVAAMGYALGRISELVKRLPEDVQNSYTSTVA